MGVLFNPCVNKKQKIIFKFSLYTFCSTQKNFQKIFYFDFLLYICSTNQNYFIMETLDNIQVIVGVIFGIICIISIASFLYFQIFEKDGEEPKGCTGKFILCIILVLAAFFLVSMCGGNDNTPWQPRHTQIEKPVLNVVNELNFNNYTVS